MQEKGTVAQTHYNNIQIYKEVDNGNDEEQDPTNDSYNPYEFDDSNKNIQNTKTPVNVKESSTLLSVTKVLYLLCMTLSQTVAIMPFKGKRLINILVNGMEWLEVVVWRKEDIIIMC